MDGNTTAIDAAEANDHIVLTIRQTGGAELTVVDFTVTAANDVMGHTGRPSHREVFGVTPDGETVSVNSHPRAGAEGVKIDRRARGELVRATAR